MSKRQTRRSISIRGISYERLRNFCEREGKTISGYLEEVIAEKMQEEGVPVPTVLRPRPKANTGRKPRESSDPSEFFPGYVEL